MIIFFFIEQWLANVLLKILILNRKWSPSIQCLPILCWLQAWWTNIYLSRYLPIIKTSWGWVTDLIYIWSTCSRNYILLKIYIFFPKNMFSFIFVEDSFLVHLEWGLFYSSSQGVSGKLPTLRCFCVLYGATNWAENGEVFTRPMVFTRSGHVYCVW